MMNAKHRTVELDANEFDWKREPDENHPFADKNAIEADGWTLVGVKMNRDMPGGLVLLYAAKE